MTIQEATDKAIELSFDVFQNGAYETPMEMREFDFFYGKHRYGSIKIKKTRQFIHSHYWKTQDEFITKVSVESWEQNLFDFIKLVKERKVKEKIREINEDFR